METTSPDGANLESRRPFGPTNSNSEMPPANVHTNAGLAVARRRWQIVNCVLGDPNRNREHSGF